MKEQWTTYRPSNGTEGMYFQSAWCDNCWHDRHAEKDPCKGCQILANTMLYDVTDPEYPKEWVCNEKREAKCTKYLSYEDHAKQLASRHHTTRYELREKHGQQRLLI